MTVRSQAVWWPRVQAIVLSLFVAGAGAFTVRQCLPADRELTRVQRAAATARERLAAAAARTQELSKLIAEIRSLREAAPGSPARGLIPERVAQDLIQASRKTHLQRLTVQPGAAVASGGCRKIPVSLNFEGDFLDAFAFMARAEARMPLTRVGSLQVLAAPGAPGRVEVQLSMNVYTPED